MTVAFAQIEPDPVDDSDSAWLRAILTAPVYDLVEQTPLTAARGLSARLGAEVLLKREDLQPVHSFKLRGAYNRLLQLTEAERERGILAVSAGNHAQGVAMAARRLGIDALIVMPATTPAIKSRAVEALGARILLHGDSYDDAAQHGFEIARREGRRIIHPFDDRAVIAGQGTVAMELLAQHGGRLDAVFIPVGGGGLCAGMAAYIKALRPQIRVVAVEPDDAACLAAALRAGRPVPLDEVGLFVDGCAVRQIGEATFRVLKDRVDEVVTVDADQVCAAIRDVFEDTRALAEPAGALAIAGMKRWAEDNDARGATLVAILSGANIGFERLSYVAERAEIGDRHEALFGVTIPERPGSFLAFARLLGRRAITEFNYRYRDDRQAQVYVGVRLKQAAERSVLLDTLRQSGFEATDYTENETARQHVRHLIGGDCPERERLLRFEFPERPGALLHFLETLGGRYNISLFHYRSHGAAYGRVLAGFEVPQSADAAFAADLAKLGYWYQEETGNPALRQFLGMRRG
ncbi:MAG: threonine ammonia-lyase, biosynthetic [Gammaproteobacteria bacterium HGW-Gammaproteobacteria-7]|nr:MAG: threonine ammonia-lyase, biosynthetic [Gammaproteobacteria bacterium HGW-Gammaproteobacteria-7]